MILGKTYPEPLPKNYDRSKDAFELYKAVYCEHILRKRKNGKLYWILPSVEPIEVSGDIICNFCGEHLKQFQIVIKSDPALVKKDDRTFFMKWLNLMSSCMWKPYNISVLPVTGGLNNTKQSFGNDRLDAFVCALDLYYNGFHTVLLSSGKRRAIALENTAALRAFLNSFGSAEQFCKQIYQIDKYLTAALCRSGKKDINSAARVREYLELVGEFWRQRQNFIEKTISPKW